MACKHEKGDPNCSLSLEGRQLAERTPNPDEYEVIDAVEVAGHFVLKVKYPSCIKCSFDALKVLVILGVSTVDALKWRRIDPHFSDRPRPPNEAPSPIARFPANDQGWANAKAFAARKVVRPR